MMIYNIKLFFVYIYLLMKKKIIFLNKKKNPFFSIITVVKNNENKISKTIKSILKQSYKNFEYIVIDGKSIDNTLINILKFKKRINYISSEKDKGIYYAMNKGIRVSSGKVIVFVNSGDTLKVNGLKYVYDVFQSRKEIDFVFGTVLRHYSTSSILKYGFNRQRLFYNFDFATVHSTGFFLKKKNLEKIGYFNTKFKCSADYDLYYRALIKNNLIGSYTKKNQIVGEVASGGYSSKISFMEHLIEEALIRIHNGQNILFICVIFLNALAKKFFKLIK